MDKLSLKKSNFRASVVVLIVGISIYCTVKKYTK